MNPTQLQNLRLQVEKLRATVQADKDQHDTFYPGFSARLHRYLDQLQPSIPREGRASELGRIFNVTRATVGHWLTKDTPPKAQTLRELSTFLLPHTQATSPLMVEAELLFGPEIVHQHPTKPTYEAYAIFHAAVTEVGPNLDLDISRGTKLVQSVIDAWGIPSTELTDEHRILLKNLLIPAFK